MQESTTALAVYNLPFSADESEVQEFFPTAKSVNILRNQSTPPRSRGMCILQFNNPRDCQQAYDECMRGKEIEGRLLRAEYSTGRRQNSSEDGHYERNEGYNRPRPDGDSYFSQSRGGDSQSGDDCVLTVSNLPYTASERDILREFPEALRVALTLDDQGRSKGVAQLTFSNSDQCNAALNTCNQKTMGGRRMRGRISRDTDAPQGSYGGNSRNYGNERDSSNQREFGNSRDNGNQRGYGNQRDYSTNNNNQRDNGQRNYGNSRDYGNQRDFGSRGGRQFDYNSGRGGRDGNRFYSSGGGGGQQNRQGPRDFDRNDRNDRSDSRRDRSPVRGEPVRGYGSSKGPRITSAVIHRPGGASNSSSGSSSDED